MELYIGGYGQGKLNYVMQEHKGKNLMIIDGNNFSEIKNSNDEIIVINNFNEYVSRLIKDNINPRDKVIELLEKYDNCIIISDEIGNGIVPGNEFDRNFREEIGRLQIMLVEKAETVVRVICGLGQKLK